ncbi:MAG: transporter [Planctomycetota bacterium]|nr:transporter [Planctomycetota bacterium]
MMWNVRTGIDCQQLKLRLSVLFTSLALLQGTAFGDDSPFASEIPAVADTESVFLASAGRLFEAGSCDTDRAACCGESAGSSRRTLWDALSGSNCDSGPGTLMRWGYGSGETGGPNLDEPLVTDRPDFTEASSTVGKDVLQVEFGYTYTQNRDSGDETRSHSIGEPLFRYGILADWLEFRFAVFPTVQESKPAGMPSNTTSGAEDLYLGFKIGLTPQEGILPEMAIMPQMTVPSGGGAFTNGELLPGVNWLYSWSVTDDLAIAGSTQFNRAVNDTGDSYTEWAQSMSAAFSLTEELGAYTEWFALIPHSAMGVSTQHYLNGGFTYLFSNDVQFDIRAGYGLTAAADDLFVGSGLSIRFR